MSDFDEALQELLTARVVYDNAVDRISYMCTIRGRELNELKRGLEGIQQGTTSLALHETITKLLNNQ